MCLFDGDFHTEPLPSPSGLNPPHNGLDSILQSRMQYQQSGGRIDQSPGERTSSVPVQSHFSAFVWVFSRLFSFQSMWDPRQDNEKQMMTEFMLGVGELWRLQDECDIITWEIKFYFCSLKDTHVFTTVTVLFSCWRDSAKTWGLFIRDGVIWRIIPPLGGKRDVGWLSSQTCLNRKKEARTLQTCAGAHHFNPIMSILQGAAIAWQFLTSCFFS